MNEAAYWIWLLRTLGAAAAIEDIIHYFGSARGLYEAGTAEWRLSGLLSAKQLTALSRFSPSESGGVLKTCAENGWQVLTPADLAYPQQLRELRNFPPVLFVWGDASVLLRDVKLAMVGTRKASAYGLRVASLLSEALADSGAVVISGGALGVDSAAHEGALRAGGKTIAVLGCGLGTDYLRENAPLRRSIAQNGAVISEFLPFSPASRTTFPLRNRIISALSLGTVVVEAGERSGSLITARYALEQGRDVFAVPGDIISSAFTGANKLIHDGAKPVFTPMDILEEYTYLGSEELKTPFPCKTLGEMLRAAPVARPGQPAADTKVGVSARASVRRKQTASAPPKQAQTAAASPGNEPCGVLPQAASAAAQTVFRVLEVQEQHIDEISEKANLPVNACLAALTELELYACAVSVQGKKYRKA